MRSTLCSAGLSLFTPLFLSSVEIHWPKHNAAASTTPIESLVCEKKVLPGPSNSVCQAYSLHAERKSQKMCTNMWLCLNLVDGAIGWILVSWHGGEEELLVIAKVSQNLRHVSCLFPLMIHEPQATRAESRKNHITRVVKIKGRAFGYSLLECVAISSISSCHTFTQCWTDRKSVELLVDNTGVGRGWIPPFSQVLILPASFWRQVCYPLLNSDRAPFWQKPCWGVEGRMFASTLVRALQ